MSGSMDGRADTRGRVYQASGDQQIIEHHHHGDAGPGEWTSIESVRQPTSGRTPGTFRDRTDLMDRLRAALEEDAGNRVYVLHGMGGCGKTAVAHALFRHATERAHRIGLWVNASDRASLRSGMLAVAADRGAGEGELLAARNGLRAAADLVWDRLDRSGQPWLLVLDNADDPAVLQDGWLRGSPMGTVLVTTRQSAAHWWPQAELHHIGVLPRDEAAQVLCDLAPQTGTIEEARGIADRLGRLPLALTLAGGFLSHQVIEPWTMTKYGDHLDGPGQVELIDRGAAAQPHEDSRQLISSTWQLSLDALTAQGMPESTSLLRLLACYGADPLPVSLLGGLEPDGEPPRARAEAALRGLLDQSLTALVDAGVRCVQTHGVLLASVASNTPPEQAATLTGTACRLLDAVVPAVPERGPHNLLFRLLTPHALALLERSPTPAVAADALDVAVRLAIALHRTGDYLSAWELASASATAAEPTLGAEHRLVLTAHSRAGRALFRLGRFEESERLLRRVLADRERLFGDEDPDTLESYYGLNLPLQQTGRAGEGLELLRRALTGRHNVLGAGHPLTLRARAALLAYLPVPELAAVVDEAAIPLPQEFARELGADHDEAIGVRLNWAYALYVLGRLDAADGEACAVVDEYKQRFGLHFPVTFAAQSLHAQVRAALGDLEAAVRMMAEVAERREHSLGKDHPHTVKSHEFLIEFREQASRRQESE